jgi:hypothetical protein
VKIKRILFILMQFVLVASIFAQNSYWRCGTIEEALEHERRFRMILSPGYGPSYKYSKHFLVHFDTTGPNITSFAYAETVSMYAESLWGKSDEKLPWGSFNPEAAGPDDRYDIFIRNLSSYDKIFSGESLGAREYLSYIECDNNTFKTQTVIRFPLPAVNKVSILIYDQSGAVVKNFHYGKQKFGTYTLRWDGRDNKGKMVDPGIYFYTLKISGQENDKSIIFFLGDKMEAMKGELREKIPTTDSMKKTEKFGGEKPSQEMIFSDDIEVFDILALTKRKLLGITPKSTFFRAESIYKQAREGLKKVPIENGFYKPDGALSLGASSGGYLAAILAIDGYLLSKGVQPESMPHLAIFSFEKYEEVLTEIPIKGGILVSSFKIVYNNLIIPNYTQKQKVEIMDEGLEKVKFIITTLKEEAKKEKRWW